MAVSIDQTIYDKILIAETKIIKEVTNKQSIYYTIVHTNTYDNIIILFVVFLLNFLMFTVSSIRKV